VNLFTYGTLMDEEIMARAGGGRPGRRPAVLNDHQRHPLQGKSYPAIVRKKGATVAGICYLDLPESAWEALDLFEDVMYERISVLVTLADGATLPAETYLLRPEFHHMLEQGDWCFDDFIRSHKVKFEQEYCGFEKSTDSDRSP
jgi:gamma-glutamylcyclotransferase (GGCT)/AIG2-like uncharacterized protein YtfP